VGRLAYFIHTKGTRNAPSGSTGLFIHRHKGDRRWSKWVIWLIHSYTQRGPEMVQVGHLAYSFIYTKRIRDGSSGSSSLFSYTKGTGDGHLAYSCAQRDLTSQKNINVLFSLKLEHFAEFSSFGKPIRKPDITVATAYYLHTCTEKTWR
jgi:hypothetical protein